MLYSQINYTLTNFADHTEEFSHDAVNRWYLAGEEITPHRVWGKMKGQLVQASERYLVFDGTVNDKLFSFKIELLRRQYNGDAHGRGIEVTCIQGVSCVSPSLE